MRRENSCAQVTDYVAGTLNPTELTRFETHISSCADCRSWLETWQVMAEGLSCSSQAPSPLIASLVTDTETLEAAERQRIENHLEVCASCRRELELTRKALRGARRAPPFETPASWRGRLWLPSRGVAVGASLVVILVAVVWVLRPETLPSGSVRQPEILQADRQLVLQDLRVEKGSHLVARATESVVLRNGFAVDSGGSLVIELGNTQR